MEQFLSTLPARGATSKAATKRRWKSYFYPRSPRGERRRQVHRGPADQNFYPRSPRGERQAYQAMCEQYGEFLSTLPARGATPSGWPQQYLHKFLSTLPARGATRGRAADGCTRLISIHAPREGSDRQHYRADRVWHISIHAPREGSDAV